MKENKNLEFKETISNTFLKTVSAFANYGGGRILFGIKDNGEIIGIEDPTTACLDIENKINDLIKPNPSYSLAINHKNNIITLSIDDGLFKPYLYKNKAYKRNDTSTVEMDSIELKRLILIGENLYFDELQTTDNKLSFEYLFKSLKKKIDISTADINTLKTLGLYDEKTGYNNAASLLADNNNFPGIDIVRFGSDINEIIEREIIVNISILNQLDKSITFFEKYYKVEEIIGIERKTKYLIPITAFRESIANALIHRTWDVNSNIRVLMHQEKIEIFSPGCLPSNISISEFENGYISSLRNPIIANVFFRLKIIEMFGTGIRRIKESYQTFKNKPSFETKENSVCIILPTEAMKAPLESCEISLLKLLPTHIILSSSELALQSGFSKDKVLRLLNQLIEKKYVSKTGTGRSTKYFSV